MALSNAQTLLEDILRLALDEALTLQAQHSLSEEDHGALVAYFNLLEFSQQHAVQLGVSFNDPELKQLNPYALLERQSL